MKKGLPFQIFDSTYRKVPVVRILDFELWVGCKVKISQNIVPRLILRFDIFWNLQYLLCCLLEGFDVKRVFSCKNGIEKKNGIVIYTNTLPRFTNFRNHFLQINFSLICYYVINAITISQERNVQFHKFLHQN